MIQCPHDNFFHGIRVTRGNEEVRGLQLKNRSMSAPCFPKAYVGTSGLEIELIIQAGPRSAKPPLFLNILASAVGLGEDMGSDGSGSNTWATTFTGVSLEGADKSP